MALIDSDLNQLAHKVRLGKSIRGRAWHVLLQLLCCAQKIPHVQLTDAAKSELISHMSRITEFEPAAAILLGSTVVGGFTLEPRWEVGFYDIATRPFGKVTNIQGVPFVFVTRGAFTRLNGATLDFRNGRFVVDGAKDSP